MTVVVDVAIGIVFLYLLLALVSTTLQELLATVTRARAVHLYAALKSLLGGKFEAFENHVLIDSLREKPGERNFPSYIPSKAFADALLDIVLGKVLVTKATGLDALIQEVNETIVKVENQRIREALQLFMKQVALEASKVDDVGRLLGERVEAWFNDRMARVSGWYKRRAQCIALVIAVIVTGVSGADTIHVADRLWHDDALRVSIAATAAAYHGSHAAPAPASAEADVSAELERLSTQLQTQTTELKAASYPIGWDRTWNCPSDVALTALGLILTILAVSLGSGFWFDILGKVLQLRGTGPKVSVAGSVEAPPNQ